MVASALTMVLTDSLPRPRAFTVREYHRMIDAGILDEDDDVELLEGVIVAMSPQGVPHARVIQILTGLIARALPRTLALRVQLPLTLADSEPEPDLAVVPAATATQDHHPSTAFLVIEIAGSSQGLDLGAKAQIYASASVKEYWVVDLAAQRVVVHRSPRVAERRFARVTVVEGGAELRSQALPRVRLALTTIFGR